MTDPDMTDPDMTDPLQVVMDVDRHTMDRLRADLVERANSGGLLDIAYRTLDSPIGQLLLAATPVGLLRVAFANEGHDEVLAQLAQRVSPRIMRAPSRLDAAAAQIDDYFAGDLTRFELPLDLRLSSGFRREVLDRLPEITYGHTATYAQVAVLAGRPRAVRAVGTACATNPLPIVVPCHRVVRSDGTIGAYLGGPEAKHRLIEFEAAA